MRNVIKRGAHASAVLIGAMRTALPALFGLAGVLFVGVCCLLGFGLPWLPHAVQPLRGLAGVERARAGAELGRHIQAPYRRLSGSWWRQALGVLRDPATWRDVVWLVLHGFGGVFLGFCTAAMWPVAILGGTIPLWWWLLPKNEPVSVFVPIDSWPKALTLPFLQVAFALFYLSWLVPRLARGQAQLSERLLRPTEMTLRMEQLTETRTEAMEAHGLELRRIERDLHDGVQAQLVSIAVRLGLAERAMAAEPNAAQDLLRGARDGIEDSLGNLRTVIRGIYPPILADRGLTGAVHALAGGLRIPVTIDVPDDLPRPPAPVEAAAYFVVAESLTNITKHSTAKHVEVTVAREGARLRIVVHDDGQGGADQAGGSGLLGIRRRVAALDGTTTIDSPVGEGTTIEVLLPCES